MAQQDGMGKANPISGTKFKRKNINIKYLVPDDIRYLVTINSFHSRNNSDEVTYHIRTCSIIIYFYTMVYSTEEIRDFCSTSHS
jgi:hypothetical protein